MRFSILGPLEVQCGQKVFRPRGRLQNRLLVTLLIKADQLVTTDALIDEVWPEQQPNRVENALQAHVSRLRRALSELEPDAPHLRLVTHTTGYQLHATAQEVDSEQFAHDLNRFREQSDSSPGATIQEVRNSLATWRGPVLGGLTGGPICEAAAARYQELHLSTLELLYDMELRAGNHIKIIPELQEIIARYRDHERFWQQLMTALHFSGRKIEALAAYRRLWSHLTDELGIDPTPITQEYQRAILQSESRGHGRMTHTSQDRELTPSGRVLSPDITEDERRGKLSSTVEIKAQIG